MDHLLSRELLPRISRKHMLGQSQVGSDANRNALAARPRKPSIERWIVRYSGLDVVPGHSLDQEVKDAKKR